MSAQVWKSGALSLAVVFVLALAFPGSVAILASSSHGGAGQSYANGGSVFAHPVSTGLSGHSNIVPVGTRAVSLPGSPHHTSAVPPANAISPSAWNHSALCQSNYAKYNETFDRGVLPKDVLHTEQSPCYIGHDEPGLNFVSNASGSGSRVQFVTVLPGSGTNTASAFTVYWVGMWLSGVPCSYRGQSYLEVQLNPPYSPYNPGPNWTLQAPVWDLVPTASCDPQCQNDTAFSTIGGLPYCEDDAALSGVGTYTPTGWGNFLPGDNLVIDTAGQVRGTSGLTVWVNDTTHPAGSINWTYTSSVSTSGIALTPYYDASSWTNGGWGYGLNVEATWENCPEGPGPQPCVSYNGPAVNAVGVPTFPSISFWNSTTLGYTNPFPWVAMTSSAGACSGYAAPCFDYNSYGGTSFYPYWSLHAWGGNAWWVYGGQYPYEVNNFGQASQFNPLGFVPTYTDPTTLYALQNSTSLTAVTVTAAVADPSGVQAVNVTAFWCFGSSTPSVSSYAATLGTGPYDTALQGNWTGSVPTGGYVGTMHYWVSAESVGGVWSAPIAMTAMVSAGVSGSCAYSAPATPSFAPGLSGIRPIGGGYTLNWSESSAGIWNYTLWFNSTTGGVPFSVNVGPATNVSVPLYTDNQSFNISIVAWNAAGLQSAMAPWTLAPATLFELAAAVSSTGTPNYWINQAVVSFTGTATGGLAPYTYTFEYRAGALTTQTVVSSSTSVAVSHDFGSYYGAARVSVAITDAVGDSTTSSRLMVPIWATPLGVPQNISGGDSYVNISWSPPLSPASPVTYYTVFYTENPAWAYGLTQFWPYNYSAPYFTFLWNTTQTHLVLPVTNGVALYAQVCAWNIYGEGQLVSDGSYLNATPEQLLAGPIQSAPGGSAPFTDTFSTTVTSGTNGQITSSLYSFTGGGTVVPIVQGSNSTFWLNASYTFTTPGLKIVVVHANDAFGDTAIQTAQIWVSPSSGPGPSISAHVNLTKAWVGQPIAFTAVASGTAGPFTYLWEFGDLANSTVANTTHAYALPGTYTATVWVTSASSPNQPVAQSLTVTVATLPSVAISTSQGSAGVLSLTFTAVYAGGFGSPRFTWNFGDGSAPVSGAIVGHNYSSSGTYQVTVIATDSSSRTATASVTLELGSTSSGSNTSSGINLSGANGVLVAALAILAVVFLIGMIYFWSRARRPAVMMAPERPPEPPEGTNLP